MTDLDRAAHRQVDNWFTYHPPTHDQGLAYESVRACARLLAHDIVEVAPDVPERCQALAALREAVMWANAGIACASSETSP